MASIANTTFHVRMINKGRTAMARVRTLVVMGLLVLGSTISMQAQGPKGKDFGFGIVLGEPLGLTLKYWTSKENAWQGSIGASYFGAPRVQVDYLWHLNVFKSDVVKLIAGPGAGIGFGHEGSGFWYKDKGQKYWYYRDDADFGIGVRVITGINIIPRNTPIEIFLELGPNIGIYPDFGVGLDAGVGIRFYP
ncbi:MAG: hypothetical protein IPH85_13035 [Ignavibacteria bacterium]|nr:hypothetical protein [Ignavibacteria bacterium]MBP6510043.1 hypothetical protein [Candidatus Kapabacteria bacterium]MBK6418853.1 hypothetical protein [Ignavibacteria bacterium]MBK6760453.1 hypothetical protein [Ignavibacteria bacterium]MBK7033788.1 hypothetical protein [Ignavibacteria bacterium]